MSSINERIVHILDEHWWVLVLGIVGFLIVFALCVLWISDASAVGCLCLEFIDDDPAPLASQSSSLSVSSLDPTSSVNVSRRGRAPSTLDKVKSKVNNTKVRVRRFSAYNAVEMRPKAQTGGRKNNAQKMKMSSTENPTRAESSPAKKIPTAAAPTNIALPVPHPWVCRTDDQQYPGYPYYHNTETGEVSWEPPNAV